MKNSLIFSYLVLIVATLLYISKVYIPPVFSAAEREIEISIQSTGNKLPQASGSEVWLYSIQRSGGNIVPWSEIVLDKGWEFRKSLAVSYQYQPAIATWKGTITAPIYIFLGSHPYSGEVEIRTNDGRVWREQLYSSYQKNHVKIQISPALTVFERLISSLLFSLLVSSLIMIFSLKKEGKVDLERGMFLLGFAAAIAAGAVYSVSLARYFDGYPFNGALQFWNPLRRLSHGDLPGRDFFSFHGIGQSLFFFPLYKFLGEDFLASEFLRHFGTFLLFIVSGVYFLKTLGLPNIIALGLTLISIYFDELYPLALPQESSLGMRTSMPLLLATITYNLNKKRKNNFHFTFPLLGSLCMLWSTEQGPVALFSISLWILSENKGGYLSFIKKATYVISSSLALYFILLSIFSLGHAVDILKFSLIDIAKDQRWFFGAPPNPFIANFNDFLKSPVVYSLIYLSIGILTTIAFLLAPRLKNQEGRGLLLFAIISNTTASFLMQTGYSAEIYNTCAERAILLGACIYSYRLLPIKFKKFTPYPAYLVVLLAPIYLGEQLSDIRERALSFRNNVYYPQLRSSLGRFYEGVDKVANLVNMSGDHSFHSDYRGFLEELLAEKPNTRFDYIIHALGPNKRTEYLTLFDNSPNYIQILKKSHTGYSRWLKQEIWPYYENILRDYEPFTETSTSIVWRKSSEQFTQAESDKIVINNPTKEIDVSDLIAQSPFAGKETSYWKAEISYTLGEKYVGQGLTRYLVSYAPDFDKEVFPVSLPPYETKFTFPIIVKNSQLKFSFNSIGLFSKNSDLEIKELRLTPLQYPQIRLEAMFDTNINH